MVYIHHNLCRVLREAGYKRELLWLFLRPQWTVRQLQNSGILAVERDVEVGKQVDGGNDDRDDGVVKHLEVVRRAARMSCAYVNVDKWESWFQLHERLLSYAMKCNRTKRFVEEMEACAPRPWAKATVGLLEQEGTTSLDIVLVFGEVYFIHMDDETVVCCWLKGKTVGLTKYSFASGISETHE